MCTAYEIIGDSLYEKGPYHAQIEFSVQGFKLKKKNISFQIFFLNFFNVIWIFMDLRPLTLPLNQI